jgi:hypothetical protein
VHRDLIFFTKIKTYFGYRDPQEFWNSVMFFNFLPNAVGYHDKLYACGAQDQLERGRHRVKRLIEKYTPQIIIVFTTKGWSEFPSTREETKAELHSLVGFPSFTWGTYRSQCGTTMAFGLRHPQFAKTDVMFRAVRKILKMQPMETCGRITHP